MIRLVQLLLDAARALIRRRSDLVLENLALRQQVAVLAAKGGRPCITIVDRWFWLALRRRWSRWVLVFVKPETVGALAPRPLSPIVGPGCRGAVGAVVHEKVGASAR